MNKNSKILLDRHPINTGTLLWWTVCFVPGKESLYVFSKFNLLNTDTPLTLLVPIVTNSNFLLTISIYFHEMRLWELIKWSPKRKYFDLLSNSLNLFLKEMYRDQFEEFVCGYWGLKGKFRHFPWPPQCLY